MSIKEITEAIEQGKVNFGIREAVRHAKKAKNIYLAKDARDTTVEKLEQSKIEFTVLKSKAEMAKELNLDFESEVFSVH